MENAPEINLSLEVFIDRQPIKDELTLIASEIILCIFFLEYICLLTKIKVVFLTLVTLFNYDSSLYF